MKWFREVFIPSLDSKLGGRSSMYISEKQANVCKRYMTPQSVFDGFYIIIGDYQYTLQIMKKGYGKITKCDKQIAIR